MSFESFDLHHHLNTNVQTMGYEIPTPIQSEAIPIIMQGRDVLGTAQTGTGKTAAFALPILDRLQQGPQRCLRALIIAPTRELAEQIHDAFAELGHNTGRRLVTLYGGVNITPQIQKLRAGAEIAVACPGRLLDHIQRGTVDLRQLEVLVLDEADQMFDMGFLPTIRQIVRHIPAKRQTLLFSATMPDDIRLLANELLTDPVTVEIGRRAPVESVAHALFPVPAHLKTKLLIELLKRGDTNSVLVFARTKHRAKRIGEQLQKAGFKASSLQGNLSQNRRQAAMNGFRDGTHQILVATDIAARGIDVASISHVINYDIPDTVEAYTHRIGRTGRAAKTGDAFTFITNEDIGMVRRIEAVLKKPIERRTLEGFDYSSQAPANQNEFARPRPEHGRPRRQAPVARPAAPPRTSQSARPPHPLPAARPNNARPSAGPRRAPPPSPSQPFRSPPPLPDDSEQLRRRAEASQPDFNGPRPITLTSHLRRPTPSVGARPGGNRPGGNRPGHGSRPPRPAGPANPNRRRWS